MRRNIAKAVDGCWYSFLNVAAGSFSRYSEKRNDGGAPDAMVAKGRAGHVAFE